MSVSYFSHWGREFVVINGHGDQWRRCMEEEEEERIRTAEKRSLVEEIGGRGVMGNGPCGGNEVGGRETKMAPMERRRVLLGFMIYDTFHGQGLLI